MQSKVFLVTSCIYLLAIFINISGNRISDLHKIEDHMTAKEHDTTIDHEAFLGKDESKKYDNLTDKESRKRLRNLIKLKVDINGDEFITEPELLQWITHISMQTKEKERDDTFKMFVNSSEVLLDYETYLTRTYGSLNENELDSTSKENLEKMKIQDIRKWKMVDENKDNKLDKNEFLVFLHPEDYPKMKWLVIQEALEISDKNKDGFLDIEEYINDIWSPSSEVDKPDENMLNIEYDNFNNHRDLNKDGKLDKEEIGEWLMPSNYDAADAETQHLIQNSDNDKDGKLSMEEIIAAHELFVGSQATDYGNSLKHEEL